MASDPRTTPLMRSDLDAFEQRILALLTPIRQHSFFAAWVATTILVVMSLVGLQWRYNLPVLLADTVYVVAGMLLTAVWSHTYRTHRR